MATPVKKRRNTDGAGAYVPERPSKWICRRPGADDAQETGAGAYVPATPTPKKRRRSGPYGDDANTVNASAVNASADIPLASLQTFLDAWRTETPWLVVCKSVSMFTKCSVCEYLRLLVDQTPRDKPLLRQTLQTRLGDHFAFQAAQRLAHGRLEEECDQSGGKKWMLLIDKMDQNKTICPTIWSQLATKLFQDHEKRLITGLIGSMWFGTRRFRQHVRTTWNDCEHGSEMQSSAILENLCDAASEEGHLPESFTIGADNTTKETKNQYTMWFFVWLLCTLSDMSHALHLRCLPARGAHAQQARQSVSRISLGLRGKDYFTVEGMLQRARESMRSELRSGHFGPGVGMERVDRGRDARRNPPHAESSPCSCLQVLTRHRRDLHAVETGVRR